MPLTKNNGRYGELGHWGKRSGRRFTKKKILLLVTLLSLSLLFAVSRNGVIPIVNAGDYNSSFSHTRTLIFGDNLFSGPSGHAGGSIIFNSKVNATCAVSCGGAPIDTVLAFPALTVTSGDTIIVEFWASSAIVSTFTITDTQSNSYTQKISFIHSNPGLNVFISESQTVTTGSDTVTLTSSAQDVFAGVVSDYSGAIGFGNTATNGGSGGVGPTTGTSTITITSASSSSFIVEFMAVSGTGGICTISPASSQTLRNEYTNAGGSTGSGATDITGISGSQSLGLSWSCSTDQDQFSHAGLELIQSPMNFAQVRWNFNSTCITLKGPAQTFAIFDWSKGTAGSGGSNCNSADIMISKGQVNFQTAAGRDLEIVWAASMLNSSNLQSVDMLLRTNSTLPSFTENYSPFNDTNARMIYEVCPRISSACSGQSIYIQRDPNKNIFSETKANDLVISGATPDFKDCCAPFFQGVLNFTGPNNYVNEQSSTSTTNTSNNTASSFQMGISYNILFKMNFKGSPTGASPEMGNFFGVGPNGIPAALSIWSVPPSCADPLNRIACGLSNPQPVFQFNPLDPSSWGNAIIQGLLWVFSVAIPTGLLIIAKVLLQVIQVTFNFVGNQFGWGNIGDNFVTFLNGLPVIFGQIGTAFGWIASIVSSAVNTIIIANLLANPYFSGVINVLNDFKNAIGSGIIVSFLTQLAIWFPTSYMIILISTYFLFVFLKGIEGFFDWLHLVKWSTFILIGLFTEFIHAFGSLITAILGRLSIISPGHEFPKIPHPKAGHWPKLSLGGEIAFFDDPTAWFLAFTGFIFTMVWAGTTGAGLPGNTQTVVQAMSPLFITLFGVGFMILILYIPGYLLGKLYEKGIVS